jgi:aminoglycoside/choline kinase family phosphotransferase
VSPLDREAAIERLLFATGLGDAQRLPLAGDASTRRYERLAGGDRHAMLMDAPRSAESGPCPPDAGDGERLALGWNAVARLAASRVEAFAAVADHLRAIGLSAPQIYGVDVPYGLAVVEDLGDNLFTLAIEDGEDEVQLYCTAADVLAHLHAMPVPEVLDGLGGTWPLLTYDRLALGANADLFVDWIPAAIDAGPLPDAMLLRWERLRDALLDQALSFPRAFTIRDYHAENLIWLPDRTGVERVGLLDFQDAILGWATWDFAMLLQDARRDVSTVAAEAAIARYLRRTGMEEATFRAELSVLGAINALRILGVFARLVHRDGKQRYTNFMPREWGHLNANLRHPHLAELRAFVSDIAAPYVEPAP